MKEKNQDCIYKDICTTECTFNCLRFLQMDRLLELSNIPKIYKQRKTIALIDVDIEKYRQLKEIKDNINQFVANGKQLYICSKCTGNGKTLWSIRLMLSYFDKNWYNSYDITKGLFVHCPTLLTDLKKFGNIPEYVSRIEDAELVIWDDISFSEATPYEYENLLRLIDSRISNGKANIYTSNITKENELSKMIGTRLASRIYKGATVVEFFGKDFRNDGGNL